MLALEPNAQIISSTKSSWPHLDEKTVMNGIDDLKKNPNLIDQGALGLCGEAAFFHHVLQRRPILFGSMAKLLFMDGIGFIGDLVIRPDWIKPDLLNADYPAIVAARVAEAAQALTLTPPKHLTPMPPQADWMVLSALCDSQNYLLDFEGTPQEHYASGTFFDTLFTSSLVDWYEKSLLYSEVTADGDTDLGHVKTSVVKTNTNQVILFIKTAMIRSGSSGRHFITLETPLLIDEQQDSVYFDYWTWGHATSDGASLTVADFTDNYLGAIIAKF